MGKMRSSLLLVTLVCAVAGTATAQRRTPESEALFEEGKQLMKSGDPAGACRKFDASQNLDPRAATMMSIGACLEAQQKLASASRAYVEAHRLAIAATDSKEKAIGDPSREKVDLLASRVSTILITVSPEAAVPGLSITRNGELVGEGQWNAAVPVDGGQYTILAYAQGADEWSVTLTVANERDAKQVAIPALATKKPPPVAEPPPEELEAVAPPPLLTAPGLAPAESKPGLAPWAWYAIAGGCIVAGLAIDLGAESSSNGSWDAMDVVPLVFYGAGVGLVYKERF